MKRPNRHHFRKAVIVVAAVAIAIAAAWLINHVGTGFLSERPNPKAIASGSAKSDAALASPNTSPIPLLDQPHAVADIRFDDDEGRTHSLADFRGRVVLLNIWATWCVPCRREMPTLDRLQAKLGGPDFEVVALSIDRAGVEVVKKFYDEIAIKNLNIYIDSELKATRTLKVVGLPTTLLIDKDGRETGRLVGPAEWDTPEVISFFRKQIMKTNSSRAPAEIQSAQFGSARKDSGSPMSHVPQ